jgi:hypothetical protein
VYATVQFLSSGECRHIVLLIKRGGRHEEIFKLAGSDDGCSAATEVFFQGNSDLKIVGSSNCNDASGVVEVEKHLALTNDPADFFRGRIFTSLSKAPIGAANLSRPPIESCSDKSCKTTHPDNGPITLARFYGSADSRGKPIKPFAVDFKENTVIPLSSNNFLKLRTGSHIDIGQLEYDVIQSKGKAVLSELRAVLKDGTLAAGDTTLKFPDGSDILFSEVALDANKDLVAVSRGSFEGVLTNGSVISLGSTKDRPSKINLDRATAQLDGISAVFKGNSRTISASMEHLLLRLPEQSYGLARQTVFGLDTL